MTRLWDIGYKTRRNFRADDSNITRRAMLQRSRNTRRIPFGENMAIQIFSFSFRNLALIDGVLRTGIPSRQIR
jgi:hypothetical protein